MSSKAKRRWKICGYLLLSILVIAATQLTTLGAALLLHPIRSRAKTPPPASLQNVTLEGHSVSLRGWRGDAIGKRKGTLIYLHGIMDNRACAAGLLVQFQEKGYDVIAYDSRAHGDSGGDICTYGIIEKQDLIRVLDTLKPGPIVLK